MLRTRCGHVRLNTPSMLYAETEQGEQWCGVWARGRVDSRAPGGGRVGVGFGTLVATYLTRQVLHIATYQEVALRMGAPGCQLAAAGLCPALALRVPRSASRAEPVGVVGVVGVVGIVGGEEAREARTEHGCPTREGAMASEIVSNKPQAPHAPGGRAPGVAGAGVWLDTLGGFWTKLNNDWIFKLAGLLAYNFLMSPFPLLFLLLVGCRVRLPMAPPPP